MTDNMDVSSFTQLIYGLLKELQVLQTQLSDGTKIGIKGTSQTRPRTRLEWRGFLQQELK